MVRCGDLVSYRTPDGAWITALIAEWSGDPDSLALLVDREGHSYRPFVDRCTPTVLGEEIAQSIRELLASRRGRQILRDAHTRVTARIDARGVRREPDRIDPTLGGGAPLNDHPPLVLADHDLPWDWSKPLTGYLCYPHHLIRYLDWLKARDPVNYQIFVRREFWGHRMTDIAAELGLSRQAAGMRLARTRRGLRDRLRREPRDLPAEDRP